MNWYELVRKLFFKFDPETIHHNVNFWMKYHSLWLAPLMSQKVDPKLKVKIFNTEFSHPVGLAAGFDKNAEVLDFMKLIGFSFVEIGSVTNLPSIGNKKPRLFRLIEDESIINRMGLNNIGADAILKKLEKRKSDFPIGINIAKTHSETIFGEEAIKDFLSTYKKIGHFGAYVTLNISCPNTKEGKTFEDKGVLNELLTEIKKIKTKPTLIKFSPDLSEENFSELLKITLDHGFDGAVIGNTTKSRNGLKTSKSDLEAIGLGGLSGPQVFTKNLNLVRICRKNTPKNFAIIGVGGINSADRGLEMLEAGANLIQLYTGLIFHGPKLISEVKEKVYNRAV